MSELLEAYRQHHQFGRALAVMGPQPKPQRRIAGMPWWLAGLIIIAGIVIGNLVVPYDDRKPEIVEPTLNHQEERTQWPLRNKKFR